MNCAVHVLLTMLFLGYSVMPAWAAGAKGAKKVQVVVDGEIAREVRLYTYSGVPYFSLKQVADAYGAHAVFHPVTGKAVVSMHNRKMDVYIKSTRVLFGEKKKLLRSPTRPNSQDVLVPAELIVSPEFARFSETDTSWHPDAHVLSVERNVTVQTPRFYTKKQGTQVVIEFEEGLAYEVNDREPGRLEIAFPRGQAGRETIGVDDGVVSEIGLENKGRLAVVSIALTPGAGRLEKKELANPRRLVLDIARTPLAGTAVPAAVAAEQSVMSAVAEQPQPEQAAVAATGTVPDKADSVEAVSVPAQAVLSVPAAAPAAETAKLPPQKKKLVVLDAGHGGKDPGAVGRSGTKEKDINLKIARELKTLFEDSGEYEVALTRADDTFVPLEDRTRFANEKKADLFVSVHCNASLDRRMGGFEIYFLSEKASDPAAAATAVLENSVIELEQDTGRKASRLHSLLGSMAINEFINESSELCSLIAREAPKRTKVENRGVKQAGFYVLRGAQMPAVLVECAFLSHVGEESKLRSKKFQRQMADSIFEGVQGYMARKQEKETANAKWKQ